MFERKPEIKEVRLNREYKFMYENFVISTQTNTYLFLDSDGENVWALKFNSNNIKYGGPNDESRGAHPLSKHGSLIYGLYEVTNSPWINEQMKANRIHPRHSDSLYEGKKHFLACFKDVMFEIICRSWEEIKIPKQNIIDLVNNEISQLADQ